MTVICSGGTSSPKPGVGPTIVISSSAAGALLNNIPTPWAVPLAAYISALTYEASTFCSTDPPADPSITALDIANLLQVSNPALGLTAAQKVAQLVSRYAWYLFCQCDSVSTPAPPTPPAEPTGAPQFNPPYLPTPKVTPCTDLSGTATFQPSASIQHFFIGQSGTASDATKPRVAPGVTTMRWTLDVDHVPPSGGNTMTFTAGTFDSSGTIVINRTKTITSADTAPFHFQETVAVPAGSVWAGSGEFANYGQFVDYTVTSRIEFFCGGTPLTPSVECCPPDDALMAKIDQILGYVTLLQRHRLPFATVDGSTHTDLAAAGTLTVPSGLIGVRLSVTSTGSEVGVEAGSPNVLFEAGWVSIQTSSDVIEEHRLKFGSEIWLPRTMQEAVRFGYFLSPGVTLDVTELEAEP